MTECDLAILGAGPAGMAAAVTAAQAGLRVVLLDEQPGPGGQIYRAITRGAAEGARGDLLGQDYRHGAGLAGALAASGARCLQGATVWDIAVADNGITLTCSQGGEARQVTAARLILATGALERAVPLPGWTLPGVMSAGAGQILLKGSGVVPGRAVLAGAGPLLYLLAVQLARAGAPPLALVETTSRADGLRALPRLARGLAGWRTLAKGLGLLAELRRHGVRRITGAGDLAVEGTTRAEAVRFRAGGQEQRIGCDTVLLHQGVVPNTQITRALRLAHDWHPGQRAFVPRCDGWGETSAPGIFVAGDGAGIAGARAAEEAGRLAALQVAQGLGRITRAERDAQAQGPRRRAAAERALRPFLEAAYPVPPEILRPADATILCRCEEITAGQVRHWARQGGAGPNQIKAFGRVGMGPCQGRICGLAVTEILAEVGGTSPAAVGLARTRAPFKPVTLGELASLDGARG